jgi:EpsI family protein
MLNSQRWIPAGMLAAGCLVNGTVLARRAGPIPLRAPLTTVATTMRGLRAIDDTFPSDQVRVAAMSTYILRLYGDRENPLFTVYVGYYDEQRQGKSIHSPKNCLPGDGWEPVEQSLVTLPVGASLVTVNRYRVVNHGHNALVYYWYQGRGRVASNEFRVKYELLRDAALHGRTEEALVRIVVPVTNNQVAAADSVARDVVAPLVTQMKQVLPTL